LIEEFQDPGFQNNEIAFKPVKTGFNEITGPRKIPVKRAAHMVDENSYILRMMGK